MRWSSTGQSSTRKPFWSSSNQSFVHLWQWRIKWCHSHSSCTYGSEMCHTSSLPLSTISASILRHAFSGSSPSSQSLRHLFQWTATIHWPDWSWSGRLFWSQQCTSLWTTWHSMNWTWRLLSWIPLRPAIKKHYGPLPDGHCTDIWTSLTANWQLVLDLFTFTAQINCLNLTTSEHHLKIGMNKLPVSPTCQLWLIQHVVFADTSLKVKNQIKQIQLNLEDIAFSEAEVFKAAKVLEQISAEGSNHPTLADVHQHSAQLKKFPKWKFFFILLGLLIIFLLFFWIFCHISTHRWIIVQNTIRLIPISSGLHDLTPSTKLPARLTPLWMVRLHLSHIRTCNHSLPCDQFHVHLYIRFCHQSAIHYVPILNLFLSHPSSHANVYNLFSDW